MTERTATLYAARMLKLRVTLIALALALAGCTASSTTSSGPPTSAPPPGPPTSVSPAGMRCSEYEPQEGVTIPQDVVAVGSFCRGGKPVVAGSVRCKDGSRVWSTGGYVWWYENQPAHLGLFPEDQNRKCQNG